MHRVNVDGLNFRSEASTKSKDSVIAVLHSGHRVRKLEAAGRGWSRVEIVLEGNAVQGFVFAKHLALESHLVEDTAEGEIRAVHLEKGAVSRNEDGDRAFPLSEPGLPRRRADTVEGKRRELLRIVEFLNVETSKRYAAGSGRTYCNIYAFDYCYLSGVYLPRVWWNDRAILSLTRGETLPIRYGETVRELNANSLFDWLRDWGREFGWERTFDLTSLQDAANRGRVAVISAKRKNLEASGHICVVPPESERLDAERTDGRVTRPVHSQAGSRNHELALSKSWWQAPKFKEFGFWHADAAPSAVDPMESEFEHKRQALASADAQKESQRMARARRRRSMSSNSRKDASLPDVMSHSARTMVAAQRLLDAHLDRELGEFYEAVRTSESAGDSMSNDELQLRMPVPMQVDSVVCAVELQGTRRLGREFDVALDIGLKPVYRFYQAQYSEENRDTRRIALKVAAAPPPARVTPKETS